MPITVVRLGKFMEVQGMEEVVRRDWREVIWVVLPHRSRPWWSVVVEG